MAAGKRCTHTTTYGLFCSLVAGQERRGKAPRRVCRITKGVRRSESGRFRYFHGNFPRTRPCPLRRLSCSHASLQDPRLRPTPNPGFFRIPFLSLLFTSTAETIQSRKSRAAWRPAWKSWRNMLRHCMPPRDVASCVGCAILRQISSMQL